MFFKLEFKPGVGGGFLRAFTSQKGPGKGLPASGFAPERRESPEFPRAPRSYGGTVQKLLDGNIEGLCALRLEGGAREKFWG